MLIDTEVIRKLEAYSANLRKLGSPGNMGLQGSDRLWDLPRQIKELAGINASAEWVVYVAVCVRCGRGEDTILGGIGQAGDIPDELGNWKWFKEIKDLEITLRTCGFAAWTMPLLGLCPGCQEARCTSCGRGLNSRALQIRRLKAMRLHSKCEGCIKPSAASLVPPKLAASVFRTVTRAARRAYEIS